MIESQQIDTIIAIGNVIQGETKHFDFVCQGVTQGIVDLNIKYDVPVIFCVLTDNTKQQSVDRSGGKLGNKGIESAVAAVKMAALKNLGRSKDSIVFRFGLTAEVQSFFAKFANIMCYCLRKIQ
jgi:6,7-dimethyl-8-ribityllumazine synthase